MAVAPIPPISAFPHNPTTDVVPPAHKQPVEHMEQKAQRCALGTVPSATSCKAPCTPDIDIREELLELRTLVTLEYTASTASSLSSFPRMSSWVVEAMMRLANNYTDPRTH